MSRMTEAPWNLILGDRIYANVIAVNHYGNADASPNGGGPRIVLVPDAPVNLDNQAGVTTREVIGLTFEDGASSGGTTILDYRLWYDQSTDDWVVLVEQLPTTYYVTDFTITPGAVFAFKVQARNEVGYSEFSEPIDIQAVSVPEKPQSPETEQLGDTIEISWKEPYNGGSTITSYTLYFEHGDGVSYSTDATYCQPTAHLVETKCQIPSLHFTQAPYLIPWAGEIRVKVIASNWLGDSAESDVGGGAFIYRVPDAPISLSNVAGVTMGNQIGISWQEGPENGGLPVLDYRISFD